MSAITYIPDQPAAQVHASLQRSLIALDEAHQCSVLWFGEVMHRKLFRDLGHSSINQYAIHELGFCKSKANDFIRLAKQLENLPAVREAVASGELGYTKARELVSMATPETQDTWLKVAKGTRKELIHEVKKAKRAAKVDPGQGELLPSSPPVVARRELPVCFRMNLTPEQEARRSTGSASGSTSAGRRYRCGQVQKTNRDRAESRRLFAGLRAPLNWGLEPFQTWESVP